MSFEQFPFSAEESRDAMYTLYSQPFSHDRTSALYPPFLTPMSGPCQTVNPAGMSRLKSSPSVFFGRPAMNAFLDPQTASMCSVLDNGSSTLSLDLLNSGYLPHGLDTSVDVLSSNSSSQDWSPMGSFSASMPAAAQDHRGSVSTSSHGRSLSPGCTCDQAAFASGSSDSSFPGSIPNTPCSIERDMMAERSSFADSSPPTRRLSKAYTPLGGFESMFFDDDLNELPWKDASKSPSPQRSAFDPVHKEQLSRATPVRSTRRSNRVAKHTKPAPSASQATSRMELRRGLRQRPARAADADEDGDYEDDDGVNGTEAESEADDGSELFHVEVEVCEETPKECICGINGCTASFRRPEHLTRHRKSAKHNTTNPFVCELDRCRDKHGNRKAFNRQDNKTAHIVKTHLTPAFADKGRRDRVSEDEARALGWDKYFSAARKEFSKMYAQNGSGSAASY